MPIISAKDEETLIDQGFLTPTDSNGMRRIHKRRLYEWSDYDNQHLPLIPISETSSEPGSEMYSTIPAELVSLATIKYLGYNYEIASEIWNKWTAQAPGNIVLESIPLPSFELRFIDYVVGYSYDRRYDLDTYDDDDTKWHEVMDHCGINKDTQDAIMDPVFKDCRLNETCQFWIRDTVESRYAALDEIRKASQDREQAIQRATVLPGGSPSQQMDGPSSSGRGFSDF